MNNLALSFSKINTYDICPRQFQLQYITKTYPKDDDNPYFKKGQRLHKHLEDYVVDRLAGKDPDAKKIAAASRNALPIINKLMDKYDDVYPEQKICVDKNYKKIGWFDKAAYYRVIIDFLALGEEDAVILDYKSGKVRDYSGFGGQLHLSAFVLFMMFPRLKKVTSAYLYLEHKQTVSITIYRKDLEELRQHFDDKFIEINSDEKFEPERNDYCRFCLASGYQCEFKVKKEL